MTHRNENGYFDFWLQHAGRAISRLARFSFFFVAIGSLNMVAAYILACVFRTCLPSLSLSSWMLFPTVWIACKLDSDFEDQSLYNAYDFSFRRSWLRNALGGLLSGLIIFLGFLSVAALLQLLSIDSSSVSPYMLTNVLIVALLSLLTGFTEEFLFRGFLLNFLSSWLQRATAIVLSSAIFGFAHLNTHNALDLFWLVPAGIFLCLLRIKTGTIITSIGAHTGFQLAIGATGLFGIVFNDFDAVDWYLPILLAAFICTAILVTILTGNRGHTKYEMD